MKRKLTTVSIVFACGILLSLVLLPSATWLYIAAVCALLSFLMLLCGKNKAIMLLSLCCISFSSALVWCAAYERVFCLPLSAYDGNTLEITGVVCQAPVKTDFGGTVVVRLGGIGDASAKARLTVYGSDISNIECGTTIQTTAYIRYNLAGSGTAARALASKGYLLSCSTSDTVTELGRADNWFWYFPARFAAKLKATIAQIFPTDVSGFVTALLTGDDYLLDSDTVLSNKLSMAGIYHICAVSGMHVMFLAAVIRFLCPGQRLSAVITLIVLAVYAALTGFPASVIRASLMLAATLIAPLINREADSITSLFAALILLLFINPWSIFSAGLQMSFAAALGIILISGRFNSWCNGLLAGTRIYSTKSGKRILDTVVGILGASIGATVFTIPLSLVWFKSLSILAPITNLLVMTPVSIIFYLSAAACALGFVFIPLGRIMAWICSWLIRLVIWIAGLIAGSPIAVVYASNIPLLIFTVLLYAAILLLVYFRGSWRHAVYVGMGAVALFTLLHVGNSVLNTREGLSVTVLDVGQGQCIVLRDSGLTAVIDCGSSSVYDSGDTAAQWLAGHGENCIDIMIFTHLDTDHANGAADLFARQRIGMIAMPNPAVADGYMRENVEELAAQYGIETRYADTCLKVEFGTTVITIYPPVESGVDNRGIVILASCGDYDVLITGDIPASSEEKLIDMYRLGDIELLVVGHHGSYYSTSELLLDALRPERAVISCGENSYGHPNPDVLERLGERGILVYRTDTDGNITFSAGE